MRRLEKMNFVTSEKFLQLRLRRLMGMWMVTMEGNLTDNYA